MVSERKKLLALLNQRQVLESEYASTQDEAIKTKLNGLTPSLLHYFRCNTQEILQELYPTTAHMKAAAEKQRYFAPRKTPQQRTGAVYENLRRTGSDTDYLEFVRVSKSVFLSIVSSVLSQHQVFKNHSNNGQESVEKQLAITLWRLGHNGKDAGIGEASKIFGLSEGTIMKCTQRCMEALKDISLDVISWPSPGEKRTIKARIKDIASSTTNTTDSAATPAATSSNRNNGKKTANQGGITDAVGIVSSMNVFLVSRPLLKNTDEYLIPLHPSALASASSLSVLDQNLRLSTLSGHTESALDPFTPTSTASNKKTRVSRKTNKNKEADNALDPVDLARTLTEEQAEELRRTEKRSRLMGVSQEALPSTQLTDQAEKAATESSTSLEKRSGARQRTLVKSAYLKRDFGYNILIVCDSTTRIRFSEVTRPAGWSDQRVLESSQLTLDHSTLFDEGEYMVADSSFAPGTNVVPPFLESEIRGEHLKDDAGHAAAEKTTKADVTTRGSAHQDGDVAEEADDLEAKRKFNETLSRIQKRAMDCQKSLKARFPSLLGMRVQLKDDTASQDNARNWILACMTVHNLVLGDDSCYNPAWEAQLEEMEEQILKQQEQQARLMWKFEHHPPKKARKGTASTLAELMEADGTSSKGASEETEVDPKVGKEREGQGGEAAQEEEEERVYELMDTPTPDAGAESHHGTREGSTNATGSEKEKDNPRLQGHSSISYSSPSRRDEVFAMMQGTKAASGHSLSMLLN
ncbi:hypothetical protein BGZ54_005677 [Gamsiella multidivaricata]|nr:hypothetical protein BGZ54_005677 [Gamsiella multidivaricata]